MVANQKSFAVMRACECPVEKLRFPVLASYKIDGIRAVIKDGLAISRNLKPIRNKFIQEYLQAWAPDGLDGELVVGGILGQFQQSTSGIMSGDGRPDFTYYVFDIWNVPGRDYETRYALLQRRYGKPCRDAGYYRIKVLEQVLCHNIEDLLAFETRALEMGFEGIMTRPLDSPYKFGDSTEREQYLVKRKPFCDEECVITGFEEQFENTNPLINGERSQALAGLVGKNTLGKFLCVSKKWGDLKVGTGQGLTKELRQTIWDNQSEYIGKIIKFKYQAVGILDKPRFPIFLGFRDPDDM